MADERRDVVEGRKHKAVIYISGSMLMHCIREAVVGGEGGSCDKGEVMVWKGIFRDEELSSCRA
jgi:hypothetical protein